jgi:hypothetical protein
VNYNTYTYSLPTQETLNYFELNCWYEGKDTEKGIIAKYSGNPECNSGWWSGIFAKDFFRLITPSKFDKITCKERIEKLEQKLNI